MRAEKVINREDGSRVKIAVNIHYAGDYSVLVEKCEKGKRKFIPVGCRRERLELHDSHKERILEIVLSYASKEEIGEVLKEAWKKTKPVFDKCSFQTGYF